MMGGRACAARVGAWKHLDGTAAGYNVRTLSEGVAGGKALRGISRGGLRPRVRSEKWSFEKRIRVGSRC